MVRPVDYLPQTYQDIGSRDEIRYYNGLILSTSNSKPYFDASKYPNTANCQVLDAQISELRDEKDLVFRGEMIGDKRTVKDILLAKELQFEQLTCSQILEDATVKGTIFMTQEELKKAEERIIRQANKKRQTMLLVGGGVLLLGLAIFIK